MSTIKSSNEHLTLNADGSGKDIKFQSNGSEVASISDGGVVTATSYAGSGANLTGISSVGGATGVDFNDNVKARFGTGNDAEIYFDGTDTYIKSPSEILLRSDTNENMIKCVKDAQVNLYYDNALKLATSSTGITVTGGIAIGGTGTANTLDDYEEGTWTPTILGTTSISMRTVYNSHYTKVGNVVTLYTSFALNSSATPATGSLRFGGFPFAFKTLGESSFPITLYYSYKQTPMAFMATNGYCYYQNTNVGGNNAAGLNEGIFNNVNRNNMGMTFSYLTDA